MEKNVKIKLSKLSYLIKTLYDAHHASSPRLREQYIASQIEKEPEMKAVLDVLCNLHVHVKETPKKNEEEKKVEEVTDEGSHPYFPPSE